MRQILLYTLSNLFDLMNFIYRTPLVAASVYYRNIVYFAKKHLIFDIFKYLIYIYSNFREPLHCCAEICTDQSIRKAATSTQDTKVLAIRTNELIAKEVLYDRCI